MAPQNFCHIIIHGIITPVMLLTTVCVASHCRYLCLHVYSASEGTSVAPGAHKRKERSAAIYPNVNSAARCARRVMMTFTISRARRVT